MVWTVSGKHFAERSLNQILAKAAPTSHLPQNLSRDIELNFIMVQNKWLFKFDFLLSINYITYSLKTSTLKFISIV